MKIKALCLIAALILVGCNESTPIAMQNTSLGKVAPGESKSMAETRLERIFQTQLALFADLEFDSSKYTESDKERRLKEVYEQYQHYLADNPDDINAYILLGKYLRTVGEHKSALKTFLEANKLDPNVAVVKQQIGTLLAESGEYQLALGYFLNAIDLDPSQFIYHYQLGELLHHFKELIINDKTLTPKQLDQQMITAFRQATELNPTEFSLQLRFGEAFYDLDFPVWQDALDHWQSIESSAPTQHDRELVHLHQARVLIKLKRYKLAGKHLAKVFIPEFEKSRQELLQLIK